MMLTYLPMKGAWAEEPFDDGTMLLFVGENIELLSIASRREETPARAPAVAQVISRDDFQKRGKDTISRVISGVPGFYTAKKEWGEQPYLRGMPNSIMFLYDTVPLGSELAKSLHPIGHELSLAPVKQLEIVRGPSSVLWGPDALAGVVNVVPLSGKDFQGGEAGLLYEEPGSHKGAYFNLGQDFGTWDAFFSLSARKGQEEDAKATLVSFFDSKDSGPVPPGQRMGSKKAGDANYFDSYARINLGERIGLSGRLAGSSYPYIISSHDDTYQWREKVSLPMGYIKLDADHEIDLKTQLRFSGYFSRMNPQHEIVDKTVRQKDETYSGELLLDRSFFEGLGLLTTGLSYKRRQTDHTVLSGVYVPGFFDPENESFVPDFNSIEFTNNIWSAFAQYTHKLGDFDLMLGLRHDFHQQYKDSLSYNAAIVWSYSPELSLKLLYGTSYRSPYANQLLVEKKPDMEKSENYSLQAIWEPTPSFSLNSTLFYNRLSNHVMENLFIPGVSSPNRQDIYGIEAKALYRPLDRLELELGLSLLDNRGPDEKYRYIKSEIIRPDGSVVYNWAEAAHPYDAGPRAMFDLAAAWRVHDRLTVHSSLEYFSSRKLIYPWAESFEKASGAWLLNAGLNLHDVFTPGLDVDLFFRNITDNRYETPGTYKMINDRGFSGAVNLRYSF